MMTSDILHMRPPWICEVVGVVIGMVVVVVVVVLLEEAVLGLAGGRHGTLGGGYKESRGRFMSYTRRALENLVIPGLR